MPITTLTGSALWNKALEKGQYRYFTYLYQWMECFSKTYPHLKAIPLAHIEDGIVQSVFPLMHDENNARLLSPAFGGMGCSSSLEGLELYLDHIEDLKKKLNVKQVEFYPPPDESYLKILSAKGYRIVNSGTRYFKLPVKDRSLAQIIAENFHEASRKNYRRALRDGVSAEKYPANAESIQRFYPFYLAMTRQNNAQHSFPLELFNNFEKYMREYCHIFLARHNGIDIGAAITFTAFDSVSAWFIVTEEKYRNLRPSTLLAAAIIQHATDLGLSNFDLGPSSPTDGSFTFKERLGAVPRLHYTAEQPYSILQKLRDKTAAIFKL